MLGRTLFATLILSAAFADGALAQGRGGWVPCANEGGYCRVPYGTTVRYGAGGGWAEVETNRGVPCNNNVFGDPAEGRRKACYYAARGGGGYGGGGWAPPPPPREPQWGGGYGGEYGGGGYGGGGGGWAHCAREGEYCNFRGPATVRYGAGGSWATMRARDGVYCGNETFGDPADGRRKVCMIRR